MEGDTIAAISTPLGEGGIAVIRLSGPEALAIGDRVFRPAGKRGIQPSEAPSHTAHYGHVLDEGRVVDEVLLTVLRAPRTFTREDMAEISCHGGMLTTRRILEVLLGNGARSAEPGEFSKRAFLNGRIDLAQAEAISDLIHARTELAMAAANEQLAGKLSARVNRLRDDLMGALSHVEAHLDFPDEDIAPDTQDQLLARLNQAAEFVGGLLEHAREGQILREGVRAAIVGRPNAGKSCLLNQLLGRDRAIVSEIAGTTRDTIEETANIQGIPIRLVDTAGLRESKDQLEAEGIRRSRQSLSEAELILHVFDGSVDWSPDDEGDLRAPAGKARILIRNKMDLPTRLEFPKEIEGRRADVSCATGQGLDALKEAIKESVWSGNTGGEMLEVMINARHQDALERTRTALARTIETMRAGADLELTALELRTAVGAIGEVVGKTTTEDLLDSIFSQFCIGK